MKYDTLKLALQNVETLTFLLKDNKYKNYFYTKLIMIKYELEDQINDYI